MYLLGVHEIRVQLRAGVLVQEVAAGKQQLVVLLLGQRRDLRVGGSGAVERDDCFQEDWGCTVHLGDVWLGHCVLM